MTKTRALLLGFMASSAMLFSANAFAQDATPLIMAQRACCDKWSLIWLPASDGSINGVCSDASPVPHLSDEMAKLISQCLRDKGF